LQAHKNNELIIEIFNELGLPLHVVGTGRQEAYLQSISKPNISFLGKIGDGELRDQYSGALGYIYPQAEDFGLMPLEAAACGTATLAYGKAGALETIVAGQTGEFFGSYDKEKIKQIILNWNPENYKPDALRAQAEKFGKDIFQKNIKEIINNG
jgi:glycosyltransferase involved in cell wall biosynthesis